jgi:hypothetical protein
MLFVLAVAREDEIFFNPGWRLLLGLFISSKVVEQRQRHTFECYFMNYHTFNPRNVASSMLLIQKKGLQNTLAYKTCRLLVARAGESPPTRTIHQSSFTLLPPRQNNNLLPLPPHLIHFQIIFPSAEKKNIPGIRLSGSNT